MRYFLLALFILLNNQLSAQHLDWAKNVSNYGSNPGNGVAVDHSGNVYVTGLNYLAIKYNSAGSIIWADSIQAAGSSICVDSFGNSYITGTFGGTRDFDPGAGIVNLTATSTSAFIEKIDSAGNFVWVKQISGNDAVISNKIVRNNFGEMYITGHFKGTADFDPGPSTSNLLSQSDFDIFIVKLDAAGNLIWAKSVGGPGNDQSLSVALDNNNDVIATGVFSDSADFDPGAGSTVLSTSTPLGIFVWKLDSGGNFIFAKGMTGGWFGTISRSVAVDTSDNIFITGNFTGTIDFDPGTGTYPQNGYSMGVFVEKLDNSGNFDWVKTNIIEGKYNAVATDDTGNVYVTGYFSGTVDFNPDTTQTYYLSTDVSGESWGVFVQKLSANGDFRAALKMAGESGQFAEGMDIKLDDSAFIYVVGDFNLVSDFDPGPAGFFLTAYDQDIFTVKLSPYACPPPPAPSNISGDTLFCAGTVQTFTIDTVVGALTYTWTFPSSWWGYINYNTDTAATVYNPAPVSNGVITVVANNKCGSSEADSLFVTVRPLPVPIAVRNGAVFSTTAPFSGYQWYYNNNPIPGATSATFTGSQYGLYHVEVSDTAGCTGMSNHILFTTLGTADITKGDVIEIFPNPGNGVYVIKADVPNIDYTVSDISGRVLLKGKTTETTSHLDISSFANGIYLLKTKELVLKLVKQ
jgi:hypothetical protein